MARLIAVAVLLVSASFGQEPFQRVGACGRCHVASVVEWNMSRHEKAGTDCVACHGKSEGHVIDERNNVKPERIPREAAVAGLCTGCHGAGCGKTKKTAECQNCHHFHALVDPNKPPAKDERLERAAAAWREADERAAEGERLAGRQEWDKAAAAFREVLARRPGDERAKARIRMCERRLNPKLAGFEDPGEADPETGLPRRARVAGVGIEMVLVPGGEADIGSDRLPGAAPVHTVRVESFYLGKFEVTQAEWRALMGGAEGGRAAKDQISWEDAQALIGKLNGRVAGGGFRLPTEAEWEYAVRAGGPPETDALSRAAWFGAPRGEQGPRPVGELAPNRFGLYDTQGNVWEWCSSLRKAYPYDEADGREAAQGAGLRVLRGGGYADTADLLHPALRHSERPGRRLRWNGMRIARNVP